MGTGERGGTWAREEEEVEAEAVVGSIETTGIGEMTDVMKGATIGVMIDVTIEAVWGDAVTTGEALEAEDEGAVDRTVEEHREADETSTAMTDRRRDVIATTPIDETAETSHPTAHRPLLHSPPLPRPPHRMLRQQSRESVCNFSRVPWLQRLPQQPLRPGHPYSEKPSPERRCSHYDPRMQHPLLPPLPPLPLLLPPVLPAPAPLLLHLPPPPRPPPLLPPQAHPLPPRRLTARPPPALPLPQPNLLLAVNLLLLLLLLHLCAVQLSHRSLCALSTAL